jgi:hypothetical protein
MTKTTKKKETRKPDFVLTNLENNILVEFFIIDIEYNRAEGADFSVIIHHPYSTTTFHSIWWDRTQMLYFVEAWEKTGNTTEITQKDFNLKVGLSYYKKTLSVGLQVVQTMNSPLKEFPFSLSLSFEVTEECIKTFVENMKSLAASCRGY